MDGEIPRVDGMNAVALVGHADVGGNRGKGIMDDPCGFSRDRVDGGRVDGNAARAIGATDVVRHDVAPRHEITLIRREPDAARGNNAPAHVVADHVVDDDVVEAVGGGDTVTAEGIAPLDGLLDRIPVNDGCTADHQLDTSLRAGCDDVAGDTSPRDASEDDAAAVTVEDLATDHLDFIRVQQIEIVRVVRAEDADAGSVVVANDDVPDGQARLALTYRQAQEPAAGVLVVRVGRRDGPGAVSIEHEIPDVHVAGVPDEQHVEAGDAGLRQEHRGRSQTEDGCVGVELDGAPDHEGAPWKEEDASARGVEGVTRSENRVVVVVLAFALRAVVSNVEYPLMRHLQRLVLDDHVVDDEVVDVVASDAANCIARLDVQDVTRLSQSVVAFYEEN